MKERMNQISKKVISCLLLLTYIFLLMPTFTVGAANTKSYTLPTVSLTKEKSASLGQATFLLTLSGQAQGDVKVHVKTFDISAKAGVDYQAVDITVTLNEKNPSFTINTPISLNDNAVGIEKDGNVAYSDLFGITIVSVTNALPDPENNTLITGIDCDGNSAEVVKKNGSYVFKCADSVKQSGTIALDDTLATEKTTTKEDFEVPFSNGFKQHMLDLWRNENLDAFYNIDDLLYFNGGFTVTCSYAKGAHGETFTLETGCGIRNYYVDTDDKTPKTHSFNFFGTNSGTGSDSSITISARNKNTIFMKAADGACLKFDVVDSAMKKTFSDLAYYTTLIDLSAPEITGYRLVNLSAYEGGNAYIAVDFSEPVQLTESSLRLNVSIGGVEYSLKCVDGTFTKTLLFAFEENFDGSFVASGDIKIKGFNETTGVCDLLLNAENENNASVLPTSTDISLGTVDIDSRTPKFSNETCTTENKIAQSHSVSVELSRMDTNGKLYYAWTPSSDAYEVTQWTEKTNFVIGTNTFSENSLHGDYYLHLKAVGANGMTTYWSYGALSFDNKPKIEYISCETEGKMSSVHHVLMNITNAENVSYAWSPEESDADVSNWTNVNNFVAGQYTFTGELLSGNQYLHIKTTSRHGYTSLWRSAKPFAFDSTPPMAERVDCVTAGNALPQHILNIVMKQDDLDDLKYVYMYAMDESGNVVLKDELVYASGSGMSNLFKLNGTAATLKIGYKMLGMEVNTSAKYKIGFVFEDASGNKTDSNDVIYSPAVLFDSRGEFDVDVVEDPKTEIETVGGHEVLVSGDGESYEFRFDLDAPYSVGDQFGITQITHNGKVIFDLGSDYSGADPYKDGFGKKNGEDYGIVGIVYNPEKQSVTVKISEKAKGYYTFSFFYNEKVATDIPVYFTTEEDIPNNFYSISEEGLLTNRVWAFANKRYYRFLAAQNSLTEALSFEIVFERYAESGAAPIFSDKEKAYEYALFMELQDVSLVYLNESSASVVNLLNSGASGHFKKAIGETATAAMGQTWIRYKNTVWDTTQTPNAQDYAYYFYSDTQETALDYNKVMSSLVGEALSSHAKKISNYDNGEWIYLTVNTGEVDGNGEPSYRKDAVFDDTLSYQGPFANEIIYTGDSEIYSTTISGIHNYSEIKEAYILANYSFSSDGGRTVLYYREYNGVHNVGQYTEVVIEKGNSVKLKNLVTKTGLYEFIEFDGKGSRKYYIYADFHAPTLRYEYTQGWKEHEGYIDRYVSGSTIRAGSITLKEFVTNADGYAPEYDPHAYLYMTNTSGKIIAFMTASELKAMGGYTLTDDTVIVYVYDRLGNFASVTIRANESNLYAEGTVKDNEALVININRNEDEIAIGGFKLYKDNVLMELAYAPTITLYESATYTIELADIYGNTYSQSFVFQRPLPTVEFQCKDDKGDYVAMGDDINGSAYVLSLGDNAYQVIASSEIRLKYDGDAEYDFTILSGEPTLKHTKSSFQYVRIIDNGSPWMIKISHKKDPGTYIIITCEQDVTPPEIHASATTQEYFWNEENGISNVLFSEKKNTLVSLVNGQTINCRYVTIDWTDQNEIRSVTVMKDGKMIPLTESELELRSLSVSGLGRYSITVTDILNNSSTLTFNIANETNLSYYIGGKKTAYSEDPISLIQNGKYMDTQYTNKDVKLVLSEYGAVTFMYQNESGSMIYQLKYHEDGIKLYYLQNNTFMFLQNVNAAMGELFPSDAHDFVMNYEVKDGKLTLSFPSPVNGWEFWQIRVTDLEKTSPVVIQFERSNHTSIVHFVEKDTGELIETNNRNEEVYTGAKSAVTVYSPSITKEIVKISVFYSEKETFDFYRKDENILYGEGKNISEISNEGYYKIETVDIYGNSQVVYLRIGFGFEAVVEITYDNAESVEFSVEKSGSFSAKSNHSVKFTIWAEMSDCIVKAKKDGMEYEVNARSSRKYFTFTINEIGEYQIFVDDGCGNVLNFTVSIKAPTEIVYNDYLTGFNENAPYRDKLYTNGAVSMDYDKFTGDGIRYIFYRVTQNGKISEKHVIYNLLSPTPKDYKEEDFLNCIGREGNGVYDIFFADEYGNYVQKTVKIRDGVLLSISRLIETSATPEQLSLEQVLINGAWSNRSVILSDRAEASVLKVDGELVTIKNGEYVLTFPPAFAEGYEKHEVVYLDEYGNEYRFTVHLQKRNIEATIVDGINVIAVGDERYVKGSFGYTWADPQISAYYTLGTMTTHYEKGQMLSEDGKYLLVFVDYAGNTSSKVITVDTMVSYKIIIGHVRVPNGIATNEAVTVSGDGENLKVISIMKDNKLLETENLVFYDHGIYEIVVADSIGNTDKISFAIYTHAVKEFDYTAQKHFAISGVWLLGDTDKLSCIDKLSVDQDGNQTISLAETGSYNVELKDLVTGVIYVLDIIIDRTAPNVVLVGVDDGGSTRENITVMGIQKGDHVDIYRGKELIFSKTAEKDVVDPPYLSEPGNYKLIVSDEAGNFVEYEFTREFTSNAASNLIILLLLFLVGTSGFIFLIVNGKAKVK
jgi:hypothetical protein